MDAVFFTLSGQADNTQFLIWTRMASGFFVPIVPAYAFMFEHLDDEATAKGVAKMALSAMFGTAFGMMAATFAYDALGGWKWIATTTGMIALCAFFVSMATLSPSNRKVLELKTDVKAALRAPLFWSQCAMSLATGWAVSNLQLTLVIVSLLHWGLTIEEVGLEFTGIILVQLGVAVAGVKLQASQGYRRTITIGLCLVLIFGGATIATIGQSRENMYIPYTMYLFMFSGVVLIMASNQSLLKNIGSWYTTNGQGLVSGISRVIFSIGQALAPITCARVINEFGAECAITICVGLYVLAFCFTMCVGIKIWEDAKPPVIEF